MRAAEFITESRVEIVGRRFYYGVGNRPDLLILIDKHAEERLDRPGYRPLRVEEVERVMAKVPRNLELIQKQIGPGQRCSAYDHEMNIAIGLQSKDPTPTGIQRMIMTTVVPGHMTGADETYPEIELR